MMTNCGHGEYSPPDAVQEGPFSILEFWVPLNKEHERGKREDSDPNQDHHEAELFISLDIVNRFTIFIVRDSHLLQRVGQGLEPSKVADKFENSHDSHHTN